MNPKKNELIVMWRVYLSIGPDITRPPCKSFWTHSSTADYTVSQSLRRVSLNRIEFSVGISNWRTQPLLSKVMRVHPSASAQLPQLLGKFAPSSFLHWIRLKREKRRMNARKPMIEIMVTKQNHINFGKQVSRLILGRASYSTTSLLPLSTSSSSASKRSLYILTWVVVGFCSPLDFMMR